MLMRRQYALLYDTGIEGCEMVAMSDKVVRRWRRDLRAGLRSSIVVEAAEHMHCSLKEASLVVDKICSQYNRAKKERYAYLKALSQATNRDEDSESVANSSVENEGTR